MPTAKPVQQGGAERMLTAKRNAAAFDGTSMGEISSIKFKQALNIFSLPSNRGYAGNSHTGLH
jgi:hypothetical protein